MLKPRVCLISHNAYGAMTGGVSGHVGGVERQTSLMARWFAREGYDVSILTWDEGQSDGVVVDGVAIFKMCRKDAGLRFLKFLWPKWSSLNSAMKRANADVYYHNCAECVTGQAALWCRLHGRKFVFSTASDAHCERDLPSLPNFRDRVLCRYGISGADALIVQTEKQQDLMEKEFGRKSVVLPMPCPGPSHDVVRDFDHREDRVLWIGRICEAKRPDRLLDLAEMCPELTFDVVGPSSDTDYSNDIYRRAEDIPNVIFHGSKNRDEVPVFYENTKVMICTSDQEGFPNTFLEAWSYGLPIVSTFDPDNLIARRDLGFAVANLIELAESVEKMLTSPVLWCKKSKDARQYYLENHTVDSVMSRFEQVFVRGAIA